MTVYDFSFARPTPASLKAAGAVGVMRYVCKDSSKVITPAEAKSYLNAGLGLGLVYEDGAMDWSSQAAGKSKAVTAIPILKSLGWPAGRPVYAAVDMVDLPSSQYETVYQSIHAFCLATMTPDAAYGPRPFLLYCEEHHGMEWLWEMASSSANTGPEPTNKRLQQLVGSTGPLFGVDANTVMHNDWGQEPDPTPPPPSPWPSPPTTEGPVTHHPLNVPIPASGNATGTLPNAPYGTVCGVWIDGGSGPNDSGYVSAQVAGAGTSVSIRSATPGTTITVVVATNP